MEQILYSESLQQFNQYITNTSLIASLKELTDYLGQPLKILSWDDSNIAIPIDISVDLPGLGNFHNLDIREIEPILIVINIKFYPFISPRVYPDRKDFPKDQLAHLYIAKVNQPPVFCVVRGDLDEWYSNKRIKDLIIRISNWLTDAALGNLSVDGNQFDPLRLEGYFGTIIYDYDLLLGIVNRKESYDSDSNFAVGFFEIRDKNAAPSFKLKTIITPENIDKVKEIIAEDKKNEHQNKKEYIAGFILWSNDLKVFELYSVNLPGSWEELKQFCCIHSVDLSKLEEAICSLGYTKSDVPVIISIRRPSNLIGFSGNIEFINFILQVDKGDLVDGKIVNNFSVKFQAHNQPLTSKKAVEISGFNAKLENSLIVGCGALGSKIIMHLARSGATNFTIADFDKLSPHNLVRHVAFSNHEGINKATFLEEEIRKIFPNEELDLNSKTSHGEVFFTVDAIEKFHSVFDFAASNLFTQQLIKSKELTNKNICKASISDRGNLGILFYEGKDRNPRLDDLQAMLYYHSLISKKLSLWLQREKEVLNDNLNVTIGIGCNSETLVLSDDVISLHGAFISGIIKQESHIELPKKGKIYLNEIIYKPFFQNIANFIEVPAFDILPALNDLTWEIRLVPGIIKKMKQEMKKMKPKETGGVLVGRADYKTKTIHVVELIQAPNDSSSSEVCFHRGVVGLPEAISNVNNLSGNQLGYIGEWHSHPKGPEGMSLTDSNTVLKMKSEFEALPTPIPVFLIIITPKNVLTYVF